MKLKGLRQYREQYREHITIANLRLYTYNERLSILKIDSLQCRELKTDLIMRNKILYGQVDINSSYFKALFVWLYSWQLA